MDKIPNSEINIENKFIRWLDNFWYHYKWSVIGIAFAFITILICTLQMCEREKIDAYVMYAGPAPLTDGDERTNILAALKAVLPEDFNGDGEKYVELVSNYIMSEEEIEEARAEAADSDFYINGAFFSENQKKFENLIVAGEYSVCLLSPYLYESVKSANGFMPLDEIFETVPEGAIDEYGIRLSETDFGSYFPGVNELPKDTVLCMRRIGTLSSFLNKGGTKEDYEKSLKLFCAIVNYKAPVN